MPHYLLVLTYSCTKTKKNIDNKYSHNHHVPQLTITTHHHHHSQSPITTHHHHQVPFMNMTHGFLSRGDVSQPEVAKDVQRALELVVDWFDSRL
jgi:hypothetical protein